MRHGKHSHVLGVKTAHRAALMGNLASALLRHEQIETTLPKAKALRPFIEKVITMAKKAAKTDDPARKLHFRRQAYARVRDKEAVNELFEEKVGEFLKREGGYTRIYKLAPRVGDAADMALIELIPASDEGYKKSRRKGSAKKKGATSEQPAKEEADASTATATEEAPAEAEEPKAAESDAAPEAAAEEKPETSEGEDKKES